MREAPPLGLPAAVREEADLHLREGRDRTQKKRTQKAIRRQSERRKNALRTWTKRKTKCQWTNAVHLTESRTQCSRATKPMPETQPLI